MTTTPVKAKNHNPKSLSLNAADQSSIFSPVRFVDSPKSSNDPTGVRQRCFVIIRSLIDNHDKWEVAQKKGTAQCYNIEAVKRKVFDSTETKFPETLQLPCDNLKLVTSVCEDVLVNSKKCLKQLMALKQLMTNKGDVLLRTLKIDSILKFVNEMTGAYENEFPVKVNVMQNIAHSSRKEMLTYYTCMWEYPQWVGQNLGLVVKMLTLEMNFK